MDREAWRAATHGVAKSWTRLSYWTELTWPPCHRQLLPKLQVFGLFLPLLKLKVKVLVAQACPTLCGPMDCSLPGFSVQRVWEWVVIPFSKGSFQSQGSNPGLPHCRQIPYHLSHQGSPQTHVYYLAPVVGRRRQWHPTPVLLPEKSHGWRSQVGWSPWGRSESDRTERLHFHFSSSCIGEGNGNPLQYSCLENPRDRGAWWAAVYGVAQSWTRLKWLSSSSCWVENYLICLLHNNNKRKGVVSR